MRFSYAESMIDPSFYVPLVQGAEEAGYDTFLVPDSICYPEESSSKPLTQVLVVDVGGQARRNHAGENRSRPEPQVVHQRRYEEFLPEVHPVVEGVGDRQPDAGRCLIDGLGAQLRGRNHHDEAQATQTYTESCERKPERTHDPISASNDGRRIGWHLKLYML